MDYSIAFISTHIDIPDYNEPIELIENHTFRRAKTEEIDAIRSTVKKYTTNPPANYRPPYEVAYTTTTDGSSTSYKKELLSESKWKYWVIEYSGYNHEFIYIDKAFLLLWDTLEIDIHLTYIKGNIHIRTVNEQGMLKKAHDRKLNLDKPVIINTSEIKKLEDIINRIKGIDSQYRFLHTALGKFYDLRAIPEQSDLLIVGYFSIIESLVTHSPRLKESLDSISHQLANKLILLFKRFPKEVKYSDYFENTDPVKIWKKLYSYRSNIAHGNIVSFSNEHQVLKSIGNIKIFLETVIKSLLLLALEETEFVSDLKKC